MSETNNIAVTGGDRARTWATAAAILAAFTINVLSNIVPLKGQSIGDISNSVFRDVLIIPANYAFAIWGVIYLGLISFAIYQALPQQQADPRLRRGGYWMVVASLSQIVWVFLFQLGSFALSVVAMLGILGSLIVLYLQLGIGRVPHSRRQRWWVDVPISIYLGWISVATIVNIASTLDYINWGGFGLSGELWTILMLAIAGAIAAIVGLQRGDLAFNAVFIWAFVAIAVRHGDRLAIVATALGEAIALALILLWDIQQRSQAR
ncbi:tryptophan-rich sensory protein [Oxynema aestuarii]|uniref:tryptophan-rich sensory protein n=1 Tax=Oxynema aestuarii TaxID=2874213 RepID=UPI001B303E70|nr:tryptophan-rich sensory protein [Oxynema aestuarii]